VSGTDRIDLAFRRSDDPCADKSDRLKKEEGPAVARRPSIPLCLQAISTMTSG
jgi:hypothetical protein